MEKSLHPDENSHENQFLNKVNIRRWCWEKCKVAISAVFEFQKSRHSSGRKWPQVAAGGCWSKWPQVAASGHKWPQVAASGRKWPQVAAGDSRGREWPQGAARAWPQGVPTVEQVHGSHLQPLAATRVAASGRKRLQVAVRSATFLKTWKNKQLSCKSHFFQVCLATAVKGLLEQVVLRPLAAPSSDLHDLQPRGGPQVAASGRKLQMPVQIAPLLETWKKTQFSRESHFFQVCLGTGS